MFLMSLGTNFDIISILSPALFLTNQDTLFVMQVLEHSNLHSNMLCFIREFEQTMDALQGDIDSLEAEKAAAQTKLSNLSKKQMYDSLAKNSASGIGSAVGKDDIYLVFWVFNL